MSPELSAVVLSLLERLTAFPPAVDAYRYSTFSFLLRRSRCSCSATWLTIVIVLSKNIVAFFPRFRLYMAYMASGKSTRYLYCAVHAYTETLNLVLNVGCSSKCSYILCELPLREVSGFGFAPLH